MSEWIKNDILYIPELPGKPPMEYYSAIKKKLCHLQLHGFS